jgi:anti-sigma B factor antagonist
VERSSGAAPPRHPAGSGNRQLLTFRVERLSTDVSVVSLSGELDLSTIPRLEGRLFDELRARLAVVMDLSRLSFIDSSGISLLIRAFRAREHAASAELRTVIKPRSQVERVCRLAGIDRALPLYLDREAAIAATNGTSQS